MLVILPIGKPVLNKSLPNFPVHRVLPGQYCTLEPLSPENHTDALFDAFSRDSNHVDWIYLPYGPFENKTDFHHWLSELASKNDPQFYVIRMMEGEVSGMASYLRISPGDYSIEVGHIHYAPSMQKTPAATEAMYLLMKNAFELGYRRYEWKCDCLNDRSMHAASRLGFQFEGKFRHATVYKNRNRDTAWFSVIDAEWDVVRAAFESWLSPTNFNRGKQLKKLTDIRAEIKAQLD